MTQEKNRRRIVQELLSGIQELQDTTEGGYAYEDKMLEHHAKALLKQVGRLFDDVPAMQSGTMEP